MNGGVGVGVGWTVELKLNRKKERIGFQLWSIYSTTFFIMSYSEKVAGQCCIN